MPKSVGFSLEQRGPYQRKQASGEGSHEAFCSSQALLVEWVQYKEAKHTMNKGPYANIPNSFWHLFPE